MKRICILTALTLLASCSAEPSDKAQDVPDVIAGVVLDMDENPIEHIRISIKGNDTVETFTSSEGRFRHEIRMPHPEETMTLILTLEDIDGEENGGLFEGHSESILFEKQNDQPTELNLVFHLNHATASENSPQS